MSSLTDKVVTLDPGHGGHDSGALAPDGTKESNMALDVCLRAREILKKYVKVIMTRDDDTFVSLRNRPKIANKANSDVFVSYHFNSARSPHVPLGWEIYTTRGKNRSDALASCIGTQHAKRFPQQQQRSDWVDGDLDKESNFSVIRGTDHPSVLMEGEFIHTDEGAELIKDPKNRQMMAEAVAYGVLYFLKIEVNQNTKPPSDQQSRLELIEENLALALQRISQLEKEIGIT